MTREENERLVTGDSHLQYLKRMRDQRIMGIPITIALLGFVAYGCWQLDAPLKEALMVFSVPMLMFILNITDFILTSRKIKRLSDDTPDKLSEPD
jgi:hypothetical protein